MVVSVYKDETSTSFVRLLHLLVNKSKYFISLNFLFLTTSFVIAEWLSESTLLRNLLLWVVPNGILRLRGRYRGILSLQV